jgi:hypothetical protein
MRDFRFSICIFKVYFILSCRVLSWYNENLIIIEDFLRLNRILIVEKKIINNSHFQKLDKHSIDINKRHLNNNLIYKNEFHLKFQRRSVVECRVVERRIDNEIKERSWLWIEIRTIENRSLFIEWSRLYSRRQDRIRESMILYSSSTLRTNTMILLIMSLNVLQNDQKNFIRRMNSKINSCVFNDEIITKKLLIEIKYETYIYILINSKIALFNEFFRKILQSFIFRERLVFIAVDEIYLVKNWNNWRSDYERLDELRNMLFRFISFFCDLDDLEKSINYSVHW